MFSVSASEDMDFNTKIDFKTDLFSRIEVGSQGQDDLQVFLVVSSVKMFPGGMLSELLVCPGSALSQAQAARQSRRLPKWAQKDLSRLHAASEAY